jgi:hypothetical protein
MKSAFSVLFSILLTSFAASALTAVPQKSLDGKSGLCSGPNELDGSAYRLSNLDVKAEGEDLVLTFNVDHLVCKFDQTNGYKFVAAPLPTSAVFVATNEAGPNMIRKEWSQFGMVIYANNDFGTAQAARLNTTSTAQKVEYVISGGATSIRSGTMSVSAFMTYHQVTIVNGSVMESADLAGGVFNIQLR